MENKEELWDIQYGHGFDIEYFPCFLQGLLRVRGRPAVAYDQQGLVFAVAMEGGAIKLFDARSYDKVCLKQHLFSLIFLTLLTNECFARVHSW